MKNKQYIKSAILFMILIFIFPIVFMILKRTITLKPRTDH